ncbi:MAG: AbrB/MazE/SpoVT family DNA-binding domain-containing protein [Thermoplasmata archaeon]|nr:AbrB/MazE/SpoVT family DNA-binding domain-containing protein [Thermoplasmata archaeon]
MGIAVQMRKDGRIVIPQAYRQLYNLHEGDILEIEVLRIKRQDGMVIDFSQQAQEAVANGQ